MKPSDPEQLAMRLRRRLGSGVVLQRDKGRLQPGAIPLHVGQERWIADMELLVVGQGRLGRGAMVTEDATSSVVGSASDQVERERARP
jgi:hypothetical protein